MSGRPNDWQTSTSVAKLLSRFWSMGRLEMPTWGCCPNIKWYGVRFPMSLCIWVLQRHWINGRACAQWVDLLSCIQLEILFLMVRFLLSIPPLDSEWRGLPVTNTAPGHNLFISLTTAVQNFFDGKQRSCQSGWVWKHFVALAYLIIQYNLPWLASSMTEFFSIVGLKYWRRTKNTEYVDQFHCHCIMSAIPQWS